MSALIHLIWANYRHNKPRALLVFVAMITASAGLCAVLIINNTAKNSYAKANQPFLNQVEQRIVAKTGEQLSKQDYARLRRLGFTHLIPVLRATHSVTHPTTGEEFSIPLVGIDAFAIMASVQDPAKNTSVKQDTNNKLSQLWQAPYASILHLDFAKQLNLVAGQTLKLSQGNPLPRLVTASLDGLARELVLDIGQLQMALGQDTISELLVLAKENPLLSLKLADALPKHLKLETFNSAEQAAELTDSFHLNLFAMACLMFVVCMFVVMNALHLLLLKRLQNLKIARQLGVSRQQIYGALGIELLLLSALSAPIGALSGVVLAQFASPLVTQTLENLFEVRVGYSAVTYSALILKSFIAIFIGACVAAVLPFQQLNTQLSQSKMAAPTPKDENSWLLFGVILLGLACLVSIYSDNLLMSFIAIALTVFSGCGLLIYLIPKLLRVLLSMLPQSWLLIRWMAADGIRVSQKSKIAYCAFFIAVTSNLGMNFMVDSFRQATEQWLQQRLVADIYVRTQSPKEFETWLLQQDLNLQIFPRKGIEAKLLNNETVSKKLQLRSYPTISLYQDALKFSIVHPSAWVSFASGEGIFINQQLSIEYGLDIDDDVLFQVNQNPSQRKKILGVYFDYGNPKAQALLPLDSSSLSAAEVSLLAIHFESVQQEQAFIQRLNSSLLSNQVSKINTQDLMAISMQTFDRTFLITDGLNLITLLVAALSLATSVLMIDMDNRPQRALLRALGVGQYQLTSLSLVQYLLLIGFCCLIAIPFSIGLTWLLINLVNIQAFSWSYPLLISPYKLFTVSLFSTLIVLIIIALPLYKLSRRRLIEDIKCLNF